MGTKLHWVILDIIFFSILCIFHSLLLYWLSKAPIKNKTLKYPVMIYLLFNIMRVTFYMIGDLLYFSPYSPEQRMKIYDMTIKIGDVSYTIHGIAFAYFLKERLRICYQNTFLSINNKLLSIGVIIYSSAMIGVTCTYFLSVHYQNIFNIAYVIMDTIQPIYYMFILVLFNQKLYKFISFTVSNDNRLSQEINQVVLHLITKQSTILSILLVNNIIINFCESAYHIMGYNEVVTTNMIWKATLSFYFMIKSIGTYLTFPVNEKAYICICKHCHNGCVNCCSKLVKKPEGATIRSMRSIMMDNPTILALNQSENHTSSLSMCPAGNSCSIMDEMSEFLRTNSVKLQKSKYSSTNSKANILDKFDHLSSLHDNEDDLELISHNLTQCSAMSCVRYHRSTRRINVENEIEIIQENGDADDDGDIDHELTDIMDRLHVYYLHGKDTRIRASLLNNMDITTPTITMNKLSKSNKNWSYNTSRSMMSSHSSYYDEENDQIVTNKFASNLEADDNKDNKEDMYSFGYRFEYLQDKHQLFVSAKYDNIKRELVENEIIKISMDEYLTQYNKTLTYMKTRRIKSISQNFGNEEISIHHILSLLIYCNCDKYQMKWSESFRRISSDEDIESMKIRHSHFVNSSIYLIELVEKYGTRLMDVKNKKIAFYHGVNSKLYFNRTIAQFNSPLSTSLKWSVAHNFSAGCGLVLELKYAFSSFPLMAKYFNCSFFSDYPYEKECLFIGGVPILRITNITNMSDNNADYRKYIKAINVINSIFTGTYNQTDHHSYKQEDIDLAVDLINNYNDNGNNKGQDIPGYIDQLFIKYCTNLKNIVILWDSVFGKNNDMNQKLLTSLTDVGDGNFFDLRKITKLFPEIEKIEYCRESLNRQDIINLVDSVIEDMEYMNEDKTKLKYFIFHHEYSLFNEKSTHSLPMLSQPLLTDVSINLGSADDWTRNYRRNLIILCKKSEKINIDELKLEYNYIKQGYTISTILRNFT